MKFSGIKEMKAESFRRMTRVKRSTFNRMVEILNLAEQKKNSLGGKPNTLSMEDRLLMSLEYSLG